MKKLILILIAVFAMQNINAQNNDSLYVPQAISYQAIAKDTSGQPVSNATISLRASILREATNGTIEWEETHSATTDASGLFEITIGSGTRTGGEKQAFSEIDWGGAKHFLKMEIDVTGGSNFSSPAVTQFSSTPYAFKTSVSDSLSGVSMDSLRMAAAGAGAVVCCDLQNTYNVSFPQINLQLITLNNTPNNTFRLRNTDPLLLTSFESEVQTPANAYSGYFINLNATSFVPNFVDYDYGLGVNHYSIKINQNSVFGALEAHNHSQGYGIYALNSYANDPQATIGAFQRGLGDGGLFQIDNALTTSAAVRGEITSASLTVSGNAGVFLTSKLTNTANCVSVQTNGIGNAGTFFQNNLGSINNAVRATTTGPGSTIIATATHATSAVAGDFRVTSSTGNATAFRTMNLGFGVTGYFASLNNTSPFNQWTVLSRNFGNGTAGYFLNTLSTNTNTTLQALNFGAGRALYASNNNNQSNVNVAEIADLGTGTALRVYNGVTPLALNHHLAHFTLTNGQKNYTVFADADADGYGIASYISPTGTGIAGDFEIFNTANTVPAIIVTHAGTGTAVSASSGGTGVEAISGDITNTYNGLYASHIPVGSVHINSGGFAGYFDGDLNATGNIFGATKTAIVKNSQNETKVLYCDESTEYWFGDYGTGQLVNGSATLTIEPEFLSTINTSVPYQVYIQMEGPCNNAGVYVTNKTASTFDVVQQNTGSNCNSAFSYRIVAKRKGFENLRLSTPSQISNAAQQYMQTYFPEVISYNQAKLNEIAQQHSNAVPNNYSFTTPQPPSLNNEQLPDITVSENDGAIEPIAEKVEDYHATPEPPDPH